MARSKILLMSRERRRHDRPNAATMPVVSSATKPRYIGMMRAKMQAATPTENSPSFSMLMAVARSPRQYEPSSPAAEPNTSMTDQAIDRPSGSASRSAGLPT
jgi:hypothetical protein